MNLPVIYFYFPLLLRQCRYKSYLFRPFSTLHRQSVFLPQEETKNCTSVRGNGHNYDFVYFNFWVPI
jgi:hypothetical protein